MRGPSRDWAASVISSEHAYIRELRRGHLGLGPDVAGRRGQLNSVHIPGPENPLHGVGSARPSTLDLSASNAAGPTPWSVTNPCDSGRVVRQGGPGWNSRLQLVSIGWRYRVDTLEGRDVRMRRRRHCPAAGHESLSDTNDAE